MENAEVAQVLERLADMLEVQGEPEYHVRAYRRAAMSLEEAPIKVEDLVHENPRKLLELPAVGERLAEKITELVETGHLKQYDSLRERMAGTQELLGLPGLGPKKVKALIELLDIRSLADLEAACRTGRILECPGMGEKTRRNILAALARLHGAKERLKLGDARRLAASLLAYLERNPVFTRIEMAGSYRRGRETVGDLDILATADNPAAAAAYFTAYPEAARVLSQGDARASVLLRSGLQVDLRLIEPDRFGAALVYFTGSKAHNIKISVMARRLGFKISEYGIFKIGREDKPLAARREEDVYARLAMPWVAPELREDRGEIEAALAQNLPNLIRPGDIRGDLHSHTTATDGRDSIEAMLLAARGKGYQYLAVTDHTRSTRVAGGLDERRYARHLEAIRKAAAKVPGIRALCGAEVDILEDGRLDLSDAFLRELDIVLISVHSRFGMDGEAMTARILKALERPRVHVLCHPTGRLIGKRRPYEADWERIFRAARDRGVALEINAQPDRLDLPDVLVKRVGELGLKFMIDTDSHSVAQLDNMILGVTVARRGWLEPKDVLNTLDLEKFLAALR